MFLVIQMVILLDFTQSWNDAWVAEGESDQRWLYGLLALTVGAFSAVLTIAGLLFYWFKPAGAPLQRCVGRLRAAVQHSLPFSLRVSGQPPYELSCLLSCLWRRAQT